MTHAAPRLLRIGLTGPIGAGKSEVRKILEALGCATLDADAIARELRAPGSPTARAIAQALGVSSDEELRGKVMGSSPEAQAARKKLESILHPAIAERTRALLDAFEAGTPLPKALVYEAALLIQAGRASEFDEIWVVDAPAEVRLQRVLNRPGMTAELAQSLIQSQAPSAQYRAHATRVLDNPGSGENGRADLAARVAQLLQRALEAVLTR